MAETTSRTLSLLGLLQTHRQWSGRELSARLAVTERTIRRDVERLRELGYRVEATRGSLGGYRLEAGAALPPLLLTDDEAVTMAIGLRLATAQGLVDGEQTTLSALAKFEQVLPSALRRRVNALAGLVPPQAPRRVPVAQELLGELALACRDRERIRFHYVAADGTQTDRVVEPHSLVAAQRNWFLVCWDRGREAWRTFRVDRISRFFGTAVHFEPRDLPAADAAEFVAAAVASVQQVHTAEVVMTMPIEAMREYFGPWARGAVAIDAETTSWPIGSDSVEGLLATLSWIPSGVEYSVRGHDEFVAYARESAERMLNAMS